MRQAWGQSGHPAREISHLYDHQRSHACHMYHIAFLNILEISSEFFAVALCRGEVKTHWNFFLKR